MYYINANQTLPNTTFRGRGHAAPLVTRRHQQPDQPDGGKRGRPEEPERRVRVEHQRLLERTYRGGIYVKGGYRYGVAWNTVDPGSIAFGSWNANPHASNPNKPGVGYANSSPGHRVFAAASYSFDWIKALRTSVSIFYEGYTNGNTSYTFSGDINGDGGTSNDLLYVPRDQSEMNFQAFTSGTRTFTAAEQAAAWDAYISQDAYLSQHRGEYAKKYAVFLPMVNKMDLSVSQDIFKNLWGSRHSAAVPGRHRELRQHAQQRLGRRAAADQHHAPDRADVGAGRPGRCERARRSTGSASSTTS